MKKELYIILIGRMLQVISSVLLLRVITATFLPIEMGKYSLILSMTSLFSLLLINPVGMYYNRRLIDWYQSGSLGSGLNWLTLYIFIALASSLVILIGIHLIHPLSENISMLWLLLLISGSLLITTLNQTIIPSLNMLGDRLKFTIFGLLSVWVGALFSLLYTHISSATAEYWISGQLTGYLLVTCIALYTFKRLVGKASKKKRLILNVHVIKGVLSYSLPISISVGLNWVQFQSYRFIVERLSDLSFLGLFVAGYTLSSGIMSAFEATIMQYFYPLFFKKISGDASMEDKANAWKEYARVVFPLCLLTGIFVIGSASQLTMILLDNQYSSAVIFVMWGAVIETGRILGNVYSLIAHSTMNTKSLVIPQLVGAATSVIAVIVSIKIFTVHGIGVSLSIATLIYLLLIHYRMKREIALKLHIRQFFGLFLIIFPSIVCSCISLIFHGLILSLGLFFLNIVVFLASAYLVQRRTLTNGA